MPEETTGRTPEQKAADKELQTAVEKVVQAYSLIPEGTLILDYIVLGRGVRYDGEDSYSHRFQCFPEGSLDITTIMGHLAVATAQYTAYIAAGEEDG